MVLFGFNGLILISVCCSLVHILNIDHLHNDFVLLYWSISDRYMLLASSHLKQSTPADKGIQ